MLEKLVRKLVVPSILALGLSSCSNSSLSHDYKFSKIHKQKDIKVSMERNLNTVMPLNNELYKLGEKSKKDFNMNISNGDVFQAYAAYDTTADFKSWKQSGYKQKSKGKKLQKFKKGVLETAKVLDQTKVNGKSLSKSHFADAYQHALLTSYLLPGGKVDQKKLIETFKVFEPKINSVNPVKSLPTFDSTLASLNFNSKEIDYMGRIRAGSNYNLANNSAKRGHELLGLEFTKKLPTSKKKPYILYNINGLTRPYSPDPVLNPVHNTMRKHDGHDFRVGPRGEGDVVYFAGDGIVHHMNYDRNGYGHYIVIDHGPHYTMYAHLMNTRHFKKGDRVTTSDFVFEGNSGGSTAAHLHYEVRPKVSSYWRNSPPEDPGKTTSFVSQNNKVLNYKIKL